MNGCRNANKVMAAEFIPGVPVNISTANPVKKDKSKRPL
jgi:hypothetical protein